MTTRLFLDVLSGMRCWLKTLFGFHFWLKAFTLWLAKTFIRLRWKACRVNLAGKVLRPHFLTRFQCGVWNRFLLSLLISNGGLHFQGKESSLRFALHSFWNSFFVCSCHHYCNNPFCSGKARKKRLYSNRLQEARAVLALQSIGQGLWMEKRWLDSSIP